MSQQSSEHSRPAYALLLGALLLSSAACSDTDDDPALPGEAQEAVENYAKGVYATYQDSVAASKDLKEAVADFVQQPSEASLEAARDSWLAAREPYLQTEVFRFYDGPVDEIEGMLNGWPLDEAYIDYVEGDDGAGIINDLSVEISEEKLSSLNEQGGEENIATGYHAVEFLLWGQDQSEDGPGDRPFTDYVTSEQSGDDAAAATGADAGAGDAGSETAGTDSAQRRAQYLKIVSGLLTKQLVQMADAWAPGEKNYRAEFEEAETGESLRDILTGMIVLTGFETGGERLQTALDSGDQEDEHSCFSDNTHRDMIKNVQGIRSVWTGSYDGVSGSKVSGTGVREVVEVVNAELAEEIDEQIDKSVELAQALKPPFDQEIAPGNEAGRKRVVDLVESLREQEQLLQDAFVIFGFSLKE